MNYTDDFEGKCVALTTEQKNALGASASELRCECRFRT